MEIKTWLLSYGYAIVGMISGLFNFTVYLIIRRSETLRTKYHVLNYLIYANGLSGTISMISGIWRIFILIYGSESMQMSNKQCLYQSMAVWQQVVKMIDAFAFLSLSIDRLTLFSNPRFYHNYIAKLQRVIEVCVFAVAITVVMWSVYETLVAPAYTVSCFCETPNVFDLINYHSLEIIQIIVYTVSGVLYILTVRRIREIRRNMRIKEQAGCYNGLQEYFEADVSYTHTVILSAIITYIFVLTLIIFAEIEFFAATVNQIGTQYYALFTTQINGMNVVGLSVWRQIDLRKSFTNLLTCRRLKRNIVSMQRWRKCICC